MHNIQPPKPLPLPIFQPHFPPRHNPPTDPQTRREIYHRVPKPLQRQHQRTPYIQRVRWVVWVSKTVDAVYGGGNPGHEDGDREEQSGFGVGPFHFIHAAWSFDPRRRRSLPPRGQLSLWLHLGRRYRDLIILLSSFRRARICHSQRSRALDVAFAPRAVRDFDLGGAQAGEGLWRWLAIRRIVEGTGVVRVVGGEELRALLEDLDAHTEIDKESEEDGEPDWSVIGVYS
jgi:hypothetical protein